MAEVPRAHPDSPVPPPGPHDLRVDRSRSLSVMVDTNVVFRFTYRKPLAMSAKAGDLIVYWSAATKAELIRVARREIAGTVERRLREARAETKAEAVEEALGIWSKNVEAQIELLRQYFRPAPIVSADEAKELTGIVDPEDRVHVHSARAVGAPYLLTLDNRHLPHGSTFAGVQCWRIRTPS